MYIENSRLIKRINHHLSDIGCGWLSDDDLFAIVNQLLAQQDRIKELEKLISAQPCPQQKDDPKAICYCEQGGKSYFSATVPINCFKWEVKK